MNIVKSFRDDEYISRVFHDKQPEEWFEWGLTDKGTLVFKGYIKGYSEWSHWVQAEYLPCMLGIHDVRTITKIVSQFNHLLAFI